MTSRSGEASPLPGGEEVAIESLPESAISSNTAASVSPSSVAMPSVVSSGGGHGCDLASEVAVTEDDEGVVAPMIHDGAAENPELVEEMREGEEREVEESEEGLFRDEDGAVIFEDQTGEGRRVRLPLDVPVPSREMIRRQRAAGHCPYRPWCAHCVSGAANAPAHCPRADPPIGGVPEIHSDYAFFRDKKGAKDTAIVLVIKDREKSGVCAHVVPKKGVGGGFIIKQFERDIRKFGYRHKVMLRSDGEPVIRDLLDKVSTLRAPETQVEHTPVGDSKANGRAERAVQTIEKQVRVIKMSTEENLGKFSVKHPCFPWMVMHAADVLTKFKVLPDGLTAYEKIKQMHAHKMMNVVIMLRIELFLALRGRDFVQSFRG